MLPARLDSASSRTNRPPIFQYKTSNYNRFFTSSLASFSVGSSLDTLFPVFKTGIPFSSFRFFSFNFTFFLFSFLTCQNIKLVTKLADYCDQHCVGFNPIKISYKQVAI